MKITNYKITAKQLEEIESHLEATSWILNSEEIPDWEDLQTACRNIADVREDFRMIRGKAVAAIAPQTEYETSDDILRIMHKWNPRF